MTDAILVLAKLTTLREHLARMERRRPETFEAFETDVDRQDALALSLPVALQEAADIALHMAADEGWGVASSYAESFELLAKAGAISRDLAGKMAAIASLRNRVAHGYASVDAARIWREAPEGVETMRQYAAAIAAWIDPPGPP